jgi:hypothetical protein
MFVAKLRLKHCQMLLRASSELLLTEHACCKSKTRKAANRAGTSDCQFHGGGEDDRRQVYREDAHQLITVIHPSKIPFTRLQKAVEGYAEEGWLHAAR